MTETKTNLRIHKLTRALKLGHLKTEQRWLVHQEKAYLVNSLSELPTVKPFKVPSIIERLL